MPDDSDPVIVANKAYNSFECATYPSAEFKPGTIYGTQPGSPEDTDIDNLSIVLEASSRDLTGYTIIDREYTTKRGAGATVVSSILESFGVGAVSLKANADYTMTMKISAPSKYTSAGYLNTDIASFLLKYPDPDNEERRFFYITEAIGSKNIQYSVTDSSGVKVSFPGVGGIDATPWATLNKSTSSGTEELFACIKTEELTLSDTISPAARVKEQSGSIGRANYDAGRYEAAFPLLSLACATEDGLACTLVGWIHSSHRESENYVLAQRNFEKGCNFGDQGGCAAAGYQLLTGRPGVLQRTARGLEMLKSACTKGYQRACDWADDALAPN